MSGMERREDLLVQEDPGVTIVSMRCGCATFRCSQHPQDLSREMAGLLLELEWAGRDGRDDDIACPVCGEWESRGKHAHDCRLEAALKKAGVR